MPGVGGAACAELCVLQVSTASISEQTVKLKAGIDTYRSDPVLDEGQHRQHHHR